MSFSQRGRTVAYDNISAGNATGRERTILASLPSTELLGGGSGSSTSGVGADVKGYSNVVTGTILATSNPADNIASGTVCGSENVGSTIL